MPKRKNWSGFRQMTHKVQPMGSKIKPVSIETRSPESLDRERLYKTDQWVKLRRQILQANPRCYFCGAWSRTAEHIVGHGADANAVAAALRLPPVNADWRVRFWRGPFCGSCPRCAASRSNSERRGKLLQWTEQWLQDRSRFTSASAGAASNTPPI